MTKLDSFLNVITSPANILNQLQPGTWIHLEVPLSFSAYDEALLLCQISETQWVSWVPDYGEYLLQL